jgi:hypothetical protein
VAIEFRPQNTHVVAISEGGAFNDKIRDKYKLERRQKRFNLKYLVDVLLKKTRTDLICFTYLLTYSMEQSPS